METCGAPIDPNAALLDCRNAMRDTVRLNRLSAILDEQAPVPVVADRVLLALSELFAADVAVLLLAPEPGSRRLRALAGIGLPEDSGEGGFSGDENGYAAAVMRGRSPVLVDSAREDARMEPRLRELGVETAVWAPIHGSLGALGTLVLARCTPDPFPRSDGDLLTAMAHRVALVLERAAAGEERARLAALLRQADKDESLHRMAGAIAHHINNRLTAVLGYLDLAAYAAATGGDAREPIRLGIEATKKASWVGKVMLDYLGEGFRPRGRVEVGALCREVLEAARACMPEGVRLLGDLPGPGDGPLPVLGDAGDVKRVLESFLGNAMEALTGEGEVRLTVRKVAWEDVGASPLLAPGWVPASGAYVRLEVADTGCGMAPEVLQSAFDPFFTTKFLGRGLGLPVALGIVRAHGGTVSVDSEPGRGSTIRAFLPLET